MNEEKTRPLYEQTHRLRPLLFVTTIVSEGQSAAIVDLNTKCESALVCVCFGKGTAPAEIVAHWPSTTKEVVFSVLRADKWAEYKAQLSQRFSISRLSKGIAYAIPLDAVGGVSIYKMLSNTRLFEKPTPADGGKRRKKK